MYKRGRKRCKKRKIRKTKFCTTGFSITSKIDSPQTLIELLGLNREGVVWEQVKGMHGYMDWLTFGGVNIHYNGREDMGVWLEMSGQGCRTFESFGSGDYDGLFCYVLENPEELHITRLDVAFDDHTGILDMERREVLRSDWNRLQAAVNDKHAELKAVQNRLRKISEVDARFKPLVTALLDLLGEK